MGFRYNMSSIDFSAPATEVMDALTDMFYDHNPGADCYEADAWAETIIARRGGFDREETTCN